jgi:hypothetical protein
MRKRVLCPRCKNEEPLERKGPYFDPCHLCDGVLEISVELAGAYLLCIDMTQSNFKQLDDIRKLREKIPE